MHCPERCTLPPPAQCVQCWSVKQASEVAVLEWAAEVIGRKVFVPHREAIVHAALQGLDHWQHVDSGGGAGRHDGGFLTSQLKKKLTDLKSNLSIQNELTDRNR